MTGVRVGVVDVLVVRLAADGWRVLLLRRADGARCPGAWEIVHGSIERDERPAAAALREVGEETGLTVQRLYNVTVHAFHLHQNDTVQLAVAFCAFVAPADGEANRDANGDCPVRLGGEHDRHEWVTVGEATRRLLWPQERRTLADAYDLLRRGDAGPAEDVLRVL